MSAAHLLIAGSGVRKYRRCGITSADRVRKRPMYFRRDALRLYELDQEAQNCPMTSENRSQINACLLGMDIKLSATAPRVDNLQRPSYFRDSIAEQNSVSFIVSYCSVSTCNTTAS